MKLLSAHIANNMLTDTFDLINDPLAPYMSYRLTDKIVSKVSIKLNNEIRFHLRWAFLNPRKLLKHTDEATN